MGIIFKDSIRAAETVAMVVLGLWGSIALWTYVVDIFESPHYEITSLTVDEHEASPGDEFTVRIEAIKRKDCPGTFIYRIKDASGISHELLTGIIGVTPAGSEPYEFNRTFIVPEGVAPGQGEVQSVVVVTCDHEKSRVARAPPPPALIIIK